MTNKTPASFGSGDPAFTVFVTDFLKDNLEPESAILHPLASVSALAAKSEEELAERIGDADAVMMYHTISLTRGTIEKLSKCRLIVRCGVGFDNVDTEAAAECGIAVANIPDYGTEEVADSAIGMAISLARGIHRLNSLLRDVNGVWSHVEATPLRRLRGEVFGIVGLGRIGTAVASRAKALGMDVLFYDPYKPDGYDKALGIRRAPDLESLLQQALIVSIHCPLSAETAHLFDTERIDQMREGAYLVNTARGGIVDGKAVADGIESGRLSGAGLDVLEQEPPAANDPLVRLWRTPGTLAHDRVLLTPHSAFYSEDSLLDMRRKGAEACRRALLSLPLRNIVNSENLSRHSGPAHEGVRRVDSTSLCRSRKGNRQTPPFAEENDGSAANKGG